MVSSDMLLNCGDLDLSAYISDLWLLLFFVVVGFFPQWMSLLHLYNGVFLPFVQLMSVLYLFQIANLFLFV